jgi:hypothetical protein
MLPFVVLDEATKLSLNQCKSCTFARYDKKSTNFLSNACTSQKTVLTCSRSVSRSYLS